MEQVFLISIGAYLLATAALKAFYSRLFIVHVRSFKWLPDAPAALVALLFIELEAALGIALALNLYPQKLIPVTTGLILFFSAISWWGYRVKGLEACGCYGGFFQPGKYTSLAINGLLVLVLGFIWIRQPIGTSAPPIHQSRLYWLVAVILLTHFIARKTVQRPLLDLLHLRVGKVWNHRLFDIQSDSPVAERYLFLILNRSCKICREWIDRLSAIDQEKVEHRVIVLMPGEQVGDDHQNRQNGLPFPVHPLSRRQEKLLTGQLPLAVWVEDDKIIQKRLFTFPEALERCG